MLQKTGDRCHPKRGGRRPLNVQGERLAGPAGGEPHPCQQKGQFGGANVVNDNGSPPKGGNVHMNGGDPTYAHTTVNEGVEPSSMAPIPDDSLRRALNVSQNRFASSHLDEPCTFQQRGQMYEGVEPLNMVSIPDVGAIAADSGGSPPVYIYGRRRSRRRGEPSCIRVHTIDERAKPLYTLFVVDVTSRRLLIRSVCSSSDTCDNVPTSCPGQVEAMATSCVIGGSVGGSSHHPLTETSHVAYIHTYTHTYIYIHTYIHVAS
jgi:hypothetical protein